MVSKIRVVCPRPLIIHTHCDCCADEEMVHGTQMNKKATLVTVLRTTEPQLQSVIMACYLHNFLGSWHSCKFVEGRLSLVLGDPKCDVFQLCPTSQHLHRAGWQPFREGDAISGGGTKE
jgi:hypothetical protein